MQGFLNGPHLFHWLWQICWLCDLERPGHQQSSYWIWRIDKSFPSTRKDINNVHHINLDTWKKMEAHFCFSKMIPAGQKLSFEMIMQRFQVHWYILLTSCSCLFTSHVNTEWAANNFKKNVSRYVLESCNRMFWYCLAADKAIGYFIKLERLMNVAVLKKVFALQWAVAR